MNKNQDPLFFSQLECPICKTMNEYENIKSGSYSVTGKDTDFKPIGRVWQNPDYQIYDPLLFFMATCKKCYYTRELNHDYKNWQKDVSFKTYRLKNIQSAHLNALSEPNSVLKFFGSHIDIKKYPFESAVIKLLLGIFDSKLTGRPAQLDVGRYFLRIGWLFRDQDSGGGENASLILFTKLMAAANSADSQIPGYEQELENLRSLLNHEFPRVFEQVAEADRYRQNIQQAISGVSASYEMLIKANSDLKVALGEAEKSLLDSDKSSDISFFDFSSFQEFLKHASSLWDEVPISEEEALGKAARYYRKAYEKGGEIGQGIQQVQAAYMIAELSRRAGDIENANQYFNQTIRMGREIVLNKKNDKSSVSFTQKLLEMAMQQARLSRKESEGAVS